MINSSDTLPGKIAFRKLMKHQCFVFTDSDTATTSFKVRNDKDVQYSGFTWMNLEDSFVGTEIVVGTKRNDYRSNIVQFDLSGEIIDRIYEAERGEIAGLAHPSSRDRKLLFITERIGNVNTNPLEGLMRMNSIVIMDLQERTIIKRIDSIGMSANLQIAESPWLKDENRFVYSISTENKLISDGDVFNSGDDESEGVYVYDLTKNQKRLIVPAGRFAIASPIRDQIAYIKDNSIRVMDLSTNEERIVFEFDSKDKVINIHWTPNGASIYVAYFHYYFGSYHLSSSREKLIEVSSNRELSFKNIGMGFGYYTWK